MLSLRGVNKKIVNCGVTYHLLKKINLKLKKGQCVSIIGPSGSGKSSLLKIIGLLDGLDSGSIIIDDINCTNISESQQTSLRLRYIGFVFQSYNLLPDFTVLENVALPQNILGISNNTANSNAIKLLKKLELNNKIYHYPDQLSGGQKQIVAIARSLVNNPKIILADEPTGNLDSLNTASILKVLMKESKQYGVTSIIVTHNINIAEKADKIYFLQNGFLN